MTESRLRIEQGWLLNLIVRLLYTAAWAASGIANYCEEENRETFRIVEFLQLNGAQPKLNR